MKDKMISAYMQTAKIFAECSTARRLHVGAIVVKDDRIISIGYNGMPAGWDNNCEDKEYAPATLTQEDYEIHDLDKIFLLEDEKGRYRLKTKPEVLHAESNAISKLARSSESGDGATMFVTHSPCLDCAKLIYQSGISKVYYGKQYRDTNGVDFLSKCKIQIEQIDV